MTSGIIIGCVFVVLYGIPIIIFNRLVSLKNRMQNALAQIEVHLVRRLDLVPNLVNIAKGYLAHERETLNEVTKARQAAVSALKEFTTNNTSAEAASMLAAAESSLKSAMSSFNLSVEAYPELKGSANMMQLSEELITTENQVSFARQAYNDAVLAYNEYKQSFPALLFAGMFGHSKDGIPLKFDDRPNRDVAPIIEF